jgi:hypothetical protein
MLGQTRLHARLSRGDGRRAPPAAATHPDLPLNRYPAGRADTTRPATITPVLDFAPIGCSEPGVRVIPAPGSSKPP